MMNNSINQNFSPIVFVMLIMSSVGVAWLAINNIPAGMTHIIIFLTITALITLYVLFFTNEDSKQSIFKVIKVPFKLNLGVSALYYVVGLIIPFFLLIFGVQTAKAIIPLSAETIQIQLTQSFSTVQLVLNDFWRWFVTVYTAGTNEEFAFGFGAVILGVIVTDMIVRSLKVNVKNPKTIYLIGGMTLSIALFAGAHMLNATYTTIGMFALAALFRLILNIGIYHLGLALTFAIGFHQANNAIWYLFTYGSTATLNALTSLGGIIVIVINLLILSAATSAIKNLIKGDLTIKEMLQ